jgi:5'-3' exonuclease
MKTLLVDGQWLFKRNFKSQPSLKSSNGNLCGGVVGFMFSLKSIINKILPDRVVIAWDGFHAGKLRYDVYPPYKASRGKDWLNEDRAMANGGTGSPEDMEKFEFNKQKELTQKIMDELFVRQVEVEYVEADDLIAQYVLKSESDNEMIFIFSRDKDYLQLISDKVSVITSDSVWVFNREEYEKKYGHTIENELLFKSFEGDKGDDIAGVNGITRNTLIKFFPNIAKEKYLYSRLVEECYEAKKDKKNGKRKIYDKIINAEHDLKRNGKLMNLKKPFLNIEAIKLIDIVKHGTLDETRDITSAMSIFTNAGLMIYVGEEFSQDFFSPFYMLMSKEKEYSNKMKM